MIRRSLFIASLLATLLLTACHRRPLTDPEDAALLNVHLVTEGINNVTCNIYNPAIEAPVITSEAVRSLIYDPSGQPILSQGMLTNYTIDERGYETLGAAIQLSPGEYRLLNYNFDLETIQVTDQESYATIYGYTQEIPEKLYSRFGTRADEVGKIVYQPDHLMVARQELLTVRPHHDLLRIDLDAHTVVDTYYIQIRISGPEHMAANAAGVATLSGLAPGNRFGSNERIDQESVAVYFEMKKSTDPRIEDQNQDVLCATFNTFGKLPDRHSDLRAVLSILTRDGKTHQKVIDMEPIFATEDARLRHWLLIDEVWEIPVPVYPDSGGGGFNPEVDDWDDIEEVIPIGPKG
ncbi:MAG: DUF5119 domain-containing protein [Alistipes sp.]|nr:DUF5119 domain-containing protein [Alistipes sp.]